ncbi:MAG TPA: glycosyltransferase family 39 protein [Dehalococcoidia bacterium]
MLTPRWSERRGGRPHGPALLIRRLRSAYRWEGLGLAGVLLLSAGLNLYRLSSEGYGNTYYAAAVRSMLSGWHAFFYASFDAGGFVSVDKPPLGLWIQAVSAKLFGFSGLSLLLPQAIAGILSVALLWWLVRRSFGGVAGLLAALTLALTPISVVTDRNNTIDGLLVLTVLLGAWAALKAAETGRLRWLLLCAALAGLGFNIKMLQAYLVVPAFALVFLLGAPVGWRRRAAYLGLAALLLLAISLAWTTIVDLTPANRRPFVGSSGSNAELSLILGYNGLGRLTQALLGSSGSLRLFGIPIDLDVAPGFAPGIGSAGPLRLLNAGIGGQLGWLLLPAVLGLGTAALQMRARLPLDRRGQSLVLWGSWLVTAGGYFSFARFFHAYYLVMLAPAAAALCGIGFTALWQAYRRRRWLGLLLPAALLSAALVQRHLLQGYPDWDRRLTPAILDAALIACVALIAGWLAARLDRRIALVATATAVLSLQLAPAAWAAVSVENGVGGGWLPAAGPSGSFGFPAGPGGGPARRGGAPFAGGGAANGPQPQPSGAGAGAPAFRGAGPGGGPGFGGQGAMTFAGAGWDVLDPGLVRYLEARQGNARYLVATPTSSYASLFILATGRPAMALGGYQGWDRILTPGQLARLAGDGVVRFFYLPAGGSTAPGPGGGNGAGTNDDLLAWVRTNCTAVPSSAWQTASSGSSATTPTSAAARGSGPLGQSTQQLWDCGGSP